MKNFYQKKQSHKGFTLIETLFAILIFTASIVALMLLSGRSLASTQGSSDELTARYLAQEGIEVVHNIRDTNDQSGGGTWLADFPTNCGDLASPCDVDWSAPTIPALAPCGGPCLPLTRDALTGTYGAGLSEQTTFVREIVFTPTSTPDQMVVAVRVKWKQKNRARMVEFNTLLTKWRI